jgi:hypothetical protein
VRILRLVLRDVTDPDLFEHNGQYYMTETDKITARIHRFDLSLILGLFAQGIVSGQPHEVTLLYTSTKPTPRHIVNPLKTQETRQLIDISAGDSLTIEAWVKAVPDRSAARPVLACGKINSTGPLFHFFAPGSKGRALAALFRGQAELNAHAVATEQIAQLGAASEAHHVVMVVDGGAQIVSFHVDGVMLDGGDELGTGFTELAPLLEPHEIQSPVDKVGSSHRVVSAAECMVSADVLHLRVYGSKRGSGQRGYLRTSEVVATFRDGLPKENEYSRIVEE